jgi:hypoxanthine phosphoribosyltransferase
MIKKHYYSWTDVERMCVSIVNQMYTDNWRPDYIVGLTRGGNVPATIISNMTGIRCETLKVSFRDDEQGPESNLWMSEDAFGYEKTTMNILIVDDINDTGATFNWIKEDWPTSCMPMEHDRWNAVWGGNVRFATLTDNSASNAEVPVSYTCHEINKAEEDVWTVYPWENVSEY